MTLMSDEQTGTSPRVLAVPEAALQQMQALTREALSGEGDFRVPLERLLGGLERLRAIAEELNAPPPQARVRALLEGLAEERELEERFMTLAREMAAGVSPLNVGEEFVQVAERQRVLRQQREAHSAQALRALAGQGASYPAPAEAFARLHAAAGNSLDGRVPELPGD